jgi:hypothetical protein
MGRKVGKKRSKALDARLNSLYAGFSCEADAMQLTPHQLRNLRSKKK